MIRFWSAVLSCFLLAALLTPLPVTAQTPTASAGAAETTVSIDFPYGITFTAMLDTPDPKVTRADLVYHPVVDETLRMATAEIEQAGSAVTLTARADMQSPYLPAGIDLVTFWRLTFANGASLDMPGPTVSWTDPSRAWNALSSEHITLSSYALSPEFAVKVLETATATVDRLEASFGFELEVPIALWVYETVDDFRASLPTNSREAVAGVSYPGFYVIHVILRDDDERELGRTVTHELSHQVLFAATENPYGYPPIWFDEGMATHVQTAGTEGYLPLAIHAASSGKRYSLASLGSTFPYTPADAAIAYAVSWSAIEYIETTWGLAGIEAMVDQFAAGASDDDAVRGALGISLAELDAALQEWLLAQAAANVQ